MIGRRSDCCLGNGEHFRRQLLVFRGFADVPQAILTAVYGPALVGIELRLNLGFGIQNAGLKLRIAALADTYRG